MLRCPDPPACFFCLLFCLWCGDGAEVAVTSNSPPPFVSLRGRGKGSPRCLGSINKRAGEGLRVQPPRAPSSVLFLQPLRDTSLPTAQIVLSGCNKADHAATHARGQNLSNFGPVGHLLPDCRHSWRTGCFLGRAFHDDDQLYCCLT